MEKYIIILVILATIYYIQNKFLKEGFENVPAQSLGGVDDTNAINTLAQISKQLMAGGVTVPGTITLQGDLIFPNATTIRGNARLHIGGEELLYLLNKAGVMIGKEWGGNGNLTVQGNQTVNGASTVGGALTVGGGLNVGGDLNNNGNGYFSKGSSKVQIGQGYREGGACVYAMGNDLQIGASTSITRIEGALIFSGLQRKYMAGAYYFVRGHGGHQPLYNGWNFVWQDHNWTEPFRNNVKWNGSSAQNYFHHSFGVNMVQGGNGDQNWTPRFLAVMPGYKVKMYYYIGGWEMGEAQTFGPGEYDWSSGNSPGGGKRAHVFAVALDGENLPPDSVRAH